MADEAPIYACPDCGSWDTWWEAAKEIKLSRKVCRACKHKFPACWWCGAALSGKAKVKSTEGAYFCVPPCWHRRLKEDR